MEKQKEKEDLKTVIDTASEYTVWQSHGWFWDVLKK